MKPVLQYTIFITSFWEGTKAENNIKNDFQMKDINGNDGFAILSCDLGQ